MHHYQYMSRSIAADLQPDVFTHPVLQVSQVSAYTCLPVWRNVVRFVVQRVIVTPNSPILSISSAADHLFFTLSENLTVSAHVWYVSDP